MIDDNLFNGTENTSLIIFHEIFTVNTSSISSVTSIAQHVCPCCNNTYNLNCTCPAPHKNISVFPGEKFNISVVIVGQLNGAVPGNIHTTVTNKHVTLNEIHYDIDKPKCRDVPYTLYTNSKQKIDTTLQLAIEPLGDISGYVKMPHSKPLNINVTIKKCPPGFPLSPNKDCDCTQLKALPKINVSCNLTTRCIIKGNGVQSWIGVNGSVYHELCPYDYCQTGYQIAIKVTNNSSIDQQCNYNRTGILCGKCKKNLSIVFGSSECKPCNNKYLSLILLFGLAGLALVAVLTVLNLTIAEGTLSGLVFYGNIVWHNRDLFKPTKHSPFIAVLHIFLAWMNLDLGIETCFYDGMDTYQRAWLQFLFPIYIWIISIAIIFLSNRFHIFAVIASKNAVKVLATLILLSYTKFVQASAKIFARTELKFLNGTSGSIKLWWEDATVKYLGTKHSVLLSFSAIFLAIGLPYTLILLFIRQLHLFSHTRPFKWVQTLKPFLDAYTGPYTDYARPWPGLLLLTRIILSVLSQFETQQVRVSAGVVMVILLLGTAKSLKQGLYVNCYLDKLEVLFLLNLGGLYVFAFTTSPACSTPYQVLVGTAFFTFLLIVLYHVWLKCRHYRHIVAVIETITAIAARIRGKLKKKRTVRFDRLQNYPPYVNFTEDREPLLADHEEYSQ